MAKRKSNNKEKLHSLETSGFYSDINKTGVIYATLIRSPAVTGKVKSVTIPNLPEDYYIFTADDIPGEKSFELNKVSTRIFGYESVAYNGEPLAILVGPDEKTLYELAENVSVTFDIESLESALKQAIKQRKRPVVELEPLDGKQNIDKGLSDFVSQINEMPSLDTVLDRFHNEQETTEIIAKREIKYGLYEKLTIDEAEALLFDDTKQISIESWSQEIKNPSWQETNGAFCYTEGNDIHVYTPSKWTSFLQNTISSVLNIPVENIFIHKTKSTGVFSSGLWRTTLIATQTALASYLSKKPVKLQLSQKEQKLYMQPGVKSIFTYKAAVDKNGLLDTLSVNIDIDIGCANPFAKEITDRLAIAACNNYKSKNLYICAIAHTSKNPPTSATFKQIDSAAFFAIENQMQVLSRVTNIFPDEIRLLNSVTQKNSTFPFCISPDYVSETISNTLRISDFNRKYASFRMDAIDRVGNDSVPFFALPLRGVGLSCAYNPSIYLGSQYITSEIQMEVTLTAEDKVIIHAIPPSDVVQDIWKTTATEIFKLPRQNVHIDSNFSIDEIPLAPEDSYNSIGLMNELLKKCCSDIQKKRFHQPLPISSKKNVTAAMKKSWNKETFSGNPYGSLSYACTVVEVELDTYTYNEQIKGIWVTIYCGELYDEMAATKTVRLEIQQELQNLVRGRSISCKNVVINFIKEDGKSGQIGGLIHNTLPAAFSSALSLALSTKVTALPCTETQLYKLIKDRENRVRQSRENPTTENKTSEQEQKAEEEK